MIYFDEILKSKVDAVAVELGKPVYFQHGHPIAIIEELKKLAQDKESKKMQYPLVALFRDFNEEKGREVGIYSEVGPLTIIIATRTQPEYNTDKRKELSFKPILHPIWEAIERQIMYGREFNMSGTGLDYTQTDRYFWGRDSIYGNDANIFSDYIDCVEIRNLNLKIKDINC